jgi:hypothetical protein
VCIFNLHLLIFTVPTTMLCGKQSDGHLNTDAVVNMLNDMRHDFYCDPIKDAEITQDNALCMFAQFGCTRHFNNELRRKCVRLGADGADYGTTLWHVGTSMMGLSPSTWRTVSAMQSCGRFILSSCCNAVGECLGKEHGFGIDIIRLICTFAGMIPTDGQCCMPHINSTDVNGDTPLALAARVATPSGLAAVESLLKMGADPLICCGQQTVMQIHRNTMRIMKKKNIRRARPSLDDFKVLTMLGRDVAQRIHRLGKAARTLVDCPTSKPSQIAVHADTNQPPFPQFSVNVWPNNLFARGCGCASGRCAGSDHGWRMRIDTACYCNIHHILDEALFAPERRHHSSPCVCILGAGGDAGSCACPDDCMCSAFTSRRKRNATASIATDTVVVWFGATPVKKN